MKRTLSFLLLSTIAISEEVSVFGAGNLDSNKPYGLSTTEKHILKNKSELNSIDTKVKDVKDTIESVSQRIDGLESIYESDSRKINEAVLKINDLVKKEELYSSEIEKIKAVTAQILQIQEENNTNNNKNLETLKLAIATLDKSINNINSSLEQFVTKDELNKTKKSAQKEETNKTTAKSEEKLSDENANLPNDELLVKAKELFEKKLFNQALPIFESLVAKNYKPAESNFYLGEIWYARKQYNDAIGAFKKSALLYDKASYMPKLLLHSAISFENIKDKENAKNFYSTVVSAYPDSAEAQTAKKSLSKLK